MCLGNLKLFDIYNYKSHLNCESIIIYENFKQSNCQNITYIIHQMVKEDYIFILTF